MMCLQPSRVDELSFALHASLRLVACASHDEKSESVSPELTPNHNLLCMHLLQAMRRHCWHSFMYSKPRKRHSSHWFRPSTLAQLS